MTAINTPCSILHAVRAVLESELQTLEAMCVDWADPTHNAHLRQCRDLRDWLNANGVKVTEYTCSGHEALFRQYLPEVK